MNSSLCPVQGIVAEGDSITAGSIENIPIPPGGLYPQLAAALLTKGTYLNVVAIPGLSCVFMDANYATRVAPYYNPNLAVNVASIMCGANDSPPASSAYAAILSWVAKAKVTGFKVIVLTMTDASGAREAYHDALNPLIVAGAAANGYIVADMSADPFVSCDGCWMDLTYFESGQVHLNPTGLGVVATYYETALATAGLN